MKKIFLIALVSLSLFGSEITIAVAANVSYAIDELISTFNKTYPKVKVLPILSSSGNLFAQIRNGAPFGIFMSANMKYPNKLYTLGLATTKPIIYAQGALAVVSKKSLEFSNNLDSLKGNNIKSIAIANPDTAPYGKASVEAFKNAKIYADIKKKLIYAQTINQVLTYALNATDLGIVSKSALYSPKLKNTKLHYKDLNSSLYTPIKQGAVILYRQKNNENIKAFYDFIQSEKAKKIFIKYGYWVDE